ncbi:MAG: PD40 domain-containing protein [Thermoanaerobaculia bacterium]|nr:PD40 domain-containing protein [Thermoanaerobaculia bacterium]
MRRVFLLSTVLLAAISVRAQAPHDDWRTLETAHFRVHYPNEFEAWSRRAASRLESIRAAVVKEIGYDLPERIDVVITNPEADANGIAWPLLDAPRIILYTEPPGPDEQIGAYNNWIDLLAVHEVAHIIHLTRPSRNPVRRLLQRSLLPVGTIALGAPRWVHEGYATVIEGRLTGAGRPSSTLRAAILREWAANGRMPSYGQLNSDSRFAGMSMAYLAGSAFLEWLEQRSGPESLHNLWRRMTARQSRSFDGAFTGVFGESPGRLYGQFVAELTASAMTVNRTGSMAEGELWQETTGPSGEPAVSPDGTKIALVVRRRNETAEIAIWATEDSEEDRRKYEERIAKMLARDPLDVAPVRTKPLPRKPLHTFRLPDGGDIESPRWTADGSILYSHRQPDRDGFLHRDLFLWTPSTGANRRVTHLADVLDADPNPGGRTAVAVRSRHGLTQLVSVDLASGAVTQLNEPSLDIIYSHPRVSRDGKRLAYVEHRDGKWQLNLSSVDARTSDARCGAGSQAGGLPSPFAIDANVSSPEWQGDDIVATHSSRGFAEIHRLHDCAWQPLTRSSGAAFAPAPSPDGRLFFMSLEPDGFVVRMTKGETAVMLPGYDPTLVPALPPNPSQPTIFAEETLAPAREYGLGRQERFSLAGFVFAPGQSAGEIGIRAGDIVGRLDTIVIASLGNDGAQRGGAIASAWHGWPVAISAHLFHAEERSIEREGIEVRAARTLTFPRMTLTIDAGGFFGRPVDLGFFAVSARTRQRLGSWRFSQQIEGALETGDDDHSRGAFTASVSRRGWRADARYQRDSGTVDVGGLPSSIVPRSAFARRVFEPALEAETLEGDDYEGLRFGLTTPILPLSLFWQEHRTGSVSLALAGVEWSIGSGPIPLLRLPAFDVTLGAAKILDEPLRGSTRWWFGLRWRP